MTVAVIIATARSRYGPGPAAALPGGGATLLAGLVERLAALNVPDPRVVTRPEFAPALRAAGHRVTECADERADLREIARLARAADGGVAVLPGDLAAGGPVLERLLDGPAASAVTAPLPAESGAVPVRTAGGRVVAAGSMTHRVTLPDAAFVGALYVPPDRVGALAAAADRLAGLLDDGALPAQDVVPLLLVALVRAGEPVAARPAGPAPCLRPGTGEDARAALRDLAARDEDADRLAAAVKSPDGPVATLGAGYGPLITAWAARRGLTPNTVTSISFGAAALAAFWFADGTRSGSAIGAVLLFASFVLDCVDGQLARYTRAATPLGAWLDAVCDRLKEFTVYAGLAAGAVAADPRDGSAWRLAAAALGLLAVRQAIGFSYAARADPPRVLSLVEPTDVSPYRAGPSPLRRALSLELGERFLLISVVTALAGPWWTLVALLSWGGAAVCASLAGRVARSAARPAAAGPLERTVAP
ncbi:CDP-alcohol phosphatidyltransferase family protein [Actinomadura atramentaria]|uniref:CDP-alcohol phosphatidyltransferase family protein n=1 Tax=Actinomadura atramentaria TaxID=1990 RepID=UPI00036362A4|nr:CDP-alcohol phosphatidyltransferase family protein [Actinomadura atramentaria]